MALKAAVLSLCLISIAFGLRVSIIDEEVKPSRTYTVDIVWDKHYIFFEASNSTMNMTMFNIVGTVPDRTDKPLHNVSSTRWRLSGYQAAYDFKGCATENRTNQTTTTYCHINVKYANSTSTPFYGNMSMILTFNLTKNYEVEFANILPLTKYNSTFDGIAMSTKNYTETRLMMKGCSLDRQVNKTDCKGTANPIHFEAQQKTHEWLGNAQWDSLVYDCLAANTTVVNVTKTFYFPNFVKDKVSECWSLPKDICNYVPKNTTCNLAVFMRNQWKTMVYFEPIAEPIKCNSSSTPVQGTWSKVKSYLSHLPHPHLNHHNQVMV